MAFHALPNPAPVMSLVLSPITFSITHSAPHTLASLLIFRYASHAAELAHPSFREVLPPDFLIDHSVASFKPLLKYPLLNAVYPGKPTPAPRAPDFSYLLLIFFL